MTARRIRLLLTAREGARASLEAALAAACRAPREAQGLSIVWGLRVPGDPIAGTKHRAALGPAPDIHHAVVDITGEDADDAALTAAARPLLAAVGAWIDPDRSALTLGEHHLLMPTQGPYMMVFALRAPPAMSRAAFLDYWVNTHAPFIVRSSRGKGSYQHLRADERQGALAEALGIGVADYLGHAGGWMEDPSNIGAFLRHPISLEALEDERRFIDHARSFIGVYALQGGAAA